MHHAAHIRGAVRMFDFCCRDQSTFSLRHLSPHALCHVLQLNVIVTLHSDCTNKNCYYNTPLYTL